MLKKYISREPDVDGNVVPVNSTDGDTELRKTPDPVGGGDHRREGTG